MNKKFIAVAACLAIGITGAGYYFTQNRGIDSLQSTEITASEKKDALIELHDLAKEGVPQAMGKLAKEFYGGPNIKHNYGKAFYWATKGHELQDKEATFILARMYYRGEATQADPQKAINLLNEIKDESLEARYILGRVYLDQAKEDNSYYSQGISEIRAAADNGLPQAQLDMADSLRVGIMSESGPEIDKNAVLKQSAEYLAMASSQGHVPAMRQLGLYFYNGVGVPKNVEKGLGLLQDAANNGDMGAAEILEKQQFNIDEVDHG